MRSAVSLYRELLRTARSFPLSAPLRRKLQDNVRLGFRLYEHESREKRAVALRGSESVLRTLKGLAAADPESLQLLFRKTQPLDAYEERRLEVEEGEERAVRGARVDDTRRVEAELKKLDQEQQQH